jgi:hypothetical protein
MPRREEEFENLTEFNNKMERLSTTHNSFRTSQKLSMSTMIIYSLPSFGKMSCLVILKYHKLIN